MPPKRSKISKNPTPLEPKIVIKNPKTTRKQAEEKRKKEKEAEVQRQKDIDDIRRAFKEEQEAFQKQQAEKLEKALAESAKHSKARKSSHLVAGEEDTEDIEVISGDSDIQASKIEALSSLVNTLQNKVVELQSNQEYLKEAQVSTEDALGHRLNDHVKAVNKRLDTAPTLRPEDFKYASSRHVIARINAVNSLLLELHEQACQEVDKWEDSKSARILDSVFDLIRSQVEDIRIAEVSPLGFKLIEAYKDKDVGYRFVEDKEKAVELKRIEQDLIRNGEQSGRDTKASSGNKWRESRSRSRSPRTERKRSRSRSPRRSRR